MYRPEIRRVRSSIVSLFVVVGLLGAIGGAPGGAEPGTTGRPDRLGYSAFGLPHDGPSVPDLASVEPLTPAIAPTGRLYRRCVADYRHIDWTAAPRDVVDTHAAASSPDCANRAWYQETAFQNGILTFMVLVGEEALAGSGPRSDDAGSMSESLRAQGFDRVDFIEIVSSGRCEEGEVQAALFVLRPGHEPAGLDSMLESAAATGAIVDRRDAMTVITGGGTACATAIVATGNVIGWVTAANVGRLTEAVSGFLLP